MLQRTYSFLMHQTIIIIKHILREFSYLTQKCKFLKIISWNSKNIFVNMSHCHTASEKWAGILAIRCLHIVHSFVLTFLAFSIDDGSILRLIFFLWCHCKQHKNHSAHSCDEKFGKHCTDTAATIYLVNNDFWCFFFIIT